LGPEYPFIQSTCFRLHLVIGINIGIVIL